MPTTRAGFRAMVEAIDSTTDAGRAMYVNLIGMNQNAASAYTILEQRASQAANALRELQIGNVNSSFEALQRAASAQKDILLAAFNKQNDALNMSLTTASTAVSNLTSMANSLDAALKKMTGQSTEATKVIYGQGMATLQSAVAIARAGGSLSNFQGLGDALDAVTSNDTTGYADWQSFARDQGVATNLIDELNDKTKQQLTTQEVIVENLNAQIELLKTNYDLDLAALDAQLAFGQAQLDMLNGVRTDTVSVADAVKAMNASVVAALVSLAKTGAGSATQNGTINNGIAIDTAYADILNRPADAGGKQYWLDQLASGAIRYDQLEQAIKNAAVENGQLPGYAMGGYLGAGMAIFGENGPEAVDLSRGYVHNASNTRDMLATSNEDIVELLLEAVQELREIRSYSGQTVENTSKTTKTLQDVRDGGLEVYTTPSDA